MKLQIAALALLAGLLPACVSPDTEYGVKRTRVLITTRSQAELPDGPSRGDELSRLAATVYVLTWREWDRAGAGDLLWALSDEAERGGMALDHDAARDLRQALNRFRRGEGPTPVTIEMPLMVHRIVAERDGVFAVIEFNPQQNNTAVIGL